MIINATDKNTNLPFIFESTTADGATLDRVANPAGLPLQQKIAFFDRRKVIEKDQKIALLVTHRNRLRMILRDLWQRAPGPDDGEVRTSITTTKDRCVAILEKYKGYAKSGDKGFNELTLVTEFQHALHHLKGKVPDRAASGQHIQALTKARHQVGDVLARAEAGIRAWVRGASIAYRGSLATGWRNETKSVDGIAQPINLLVFDSDAFVTIPNATWAEWHRLGIVSNRHQDDKLPLPDLIQSANGARANGPEELRVSKQLDGILQVEGQLRDAMKSVAGYKRSPNNEADFGFVLQPASKTARELTAGNLYPLGQIAAAGLPLAETDLALVVESGVIKVRMPERHISMSQPVGGKTYPTDPDTPTHVSQRPTERMQIEDYFVHPTQLRPAATTERNLMAHFAAHNDNLVFNLNEGI